MYKYVAVAMIVGIATGPASALDVGGGGKVGGLGVGAGVSAGQQGVSVGVGASVDGVGGTNVGASVGTNNGSLGVGVDAGGNLGSASASTSTGNPSAAAAAASSSPVPDNTAVVSANSASSSISLPSTLMPSKTGRGELGRIITGYPFGPLASLKAKPGTPPAVVSACRAAIASAATPLGAVRVSAVSAGPMRQRHAALMAPIEVRIQYANQVRQAKVRCRLDAAGRVTAVI